MTTLWELVETETHDHLVHQGLFSQAKPGKIALAWIPGLGSTFYSHPKLFDLLATQSAKIGASFAVFNNRGHDTIAGIRKLDKRYSDGRTRYPGGAGQEVFFECTYDLAATIDFLVSQGASKVFLLGHSTGANKACYFAAKTRHPNFAGVILAGPMSDRVGGMTHRDRQEIAKNLPIMQHLNTAGKGKIPTIGYYSYPITPKRYLSLLSPNSTEDVFDYADKKPKLTLFSKIRKPLMVVIGGSDEYGNGKIPKIKAAFDAKAKSPNYKSVIIPNAPHGFDGFESQLASAITSWIKTLS